MRKTYRIHYTEIVTTQKKLVEIPIEQEEKVKRESTGVQVTILNTPFPIVTHIKALTYSELPPAYLHNPSPQVWQHEKKLFSGKGFALLEVGKSYSREYLMNALKYIQFAGEHLTMLNKDVDSEWSNYDVVKFKDGELKSLSQRKS